MGKDVRVWVYDDREGKDAGVEATHTDVPLAFDGWEGKIDLGDKNYRALSEFLAPFLAVGDGKHKAPKPRGRRPNQYYADFRAWLKDKHGIDLQPDDDGKYQYPSELRREYNRQLEETGTS